MSYESAPQNNNAELIERRKELKEKFGIVLCAKTKEGTIVPIEEQVRFSEELDLPSVQFDFRNRTKEEIQRIGAILKKYREGKPDSAISVHGESLQIEKTDLSIKAVDKMIEEIALLQDIEGDSYTVHPPVINNKLFKEISPESSSKILTNYCDVLATGLKKSIDSGKNPINISIENMPAKGEDGSWGQTTEEILSLIRKIEDTLKNQGIDLETDKYIGATLDINHALHGADPIKNGEILETWFKALGGYLKVIHLYTPSNASSGYIDKYKLCIELASRYSPNAKIFMESKQDFSITKNIFKQTKDIDIEAE